MVMPLQNSLTLKPVVEILDQMTSRQEVDRAMRRVAINRRLIAGPPTYLPLDIEARLAEALARRVGERHLGARAGQHYKYEKLSWYSDYVLSAPTLGVAFLRAAKALPVIHTGSYVSIERKGQHVVLLFHSEIQHVLGARHIDECLPMMMIDLARHFLGDTWMPDRVELPTASKPGLNDLEAIYSAPVTFRSEAAGIALDRQNLDVANPNSFSVNKRVMLRDLPSLIGVLPPRTFTDTVLQILRFQIVLDDISIDAVAERLSIGVQAMQRQLRAEGTSFRQVRELFLKARATDLLRETDHSVAEIARSLGYEETNSFRRAFRKWTGLTPTEFTTASQPLLPTNG